MHLAGTEEVHLVIVFTPTSGKKILSGAAVYSLLKLVFAVLIWLLKNPAYTASPLTEQLSHMVLIAAVSVAGIPEL